MLKAQIRDNEATTESQHSLEPKVFLPRAPQTISSKGRLEIMYLEKLSSTKDLFEQVRYTEDTEPKIFKDHFMYVCYEFNKIK